MVDVKRSKDTAQIEEAQCECGAGMGPFAHCKHINTLLYAVHVFGKTGEVKVEDTCTQKLILEVKCSYVIRNEKITTSNVPFLIRKNKTV